MKNMEYACPQHAKMIDWLVFCLVTSHDITVARTMEIPALDGDGTTEIDLE